MRAAAKCFRWQQLTDIIRPQLVTMVEHAIGEGQICRRGVELRASKRRGGTPASPTILALVPTSRRWRDVPGRVGCRRVRRGVVDRSGIIRLLCTRFGEGKIAFEAPMRLQSL
jgi:hypothetical protein